MKNNENLLENNGDGFLINHFMPLYALSLLALLMLSSLVIHVSANREELITIKQAKEVKDELQKYKLMQGVAPTLFDALKENKN